MRINFIKLIYPDRQRILVPLALLLFWTYLILGSEELIQVKAGVDRSTITIGDRITYTLTIAHAPSLHIEQPGPGANLGQFEIKDYRIHAPVQSGDLISQQFDYQISVFDTGKFVIPPFPVAFAETDTSRDYQIIQSEPIEIFVNSVLAAGDNEIRDIKPPQAVPVNYRKWVLGGLVGFFIILAAFLLYYLLRWRKKGIPLFRRETIRPAHEIALEELRLLRSGWQEMLESGEHKFLFTRLSEILRRYLENRFFIKALEETTFEISEALHDLNLEIEIKGQAISILEFSDLVKFAKYIPENQEVELNLNETEAFIHQTKLVFKPVEQSMAVDHDNGTSPEPVQNEKST